MTKEDFEKIAAIMLSKLIDHMLDKGIKVTYTKEVLSLIAEESYSEKYGARNMRRYIEKNIEDEMANVIIENSQSALRGIALSVNQGKIIINSI